MTESRKSPFTRRNVLLGGGAVLGGVVMAAGGTAAWWLWPPDPTGSVLKRLPQRIRGNDAASVAYRRTMPLDAPRARFGGFAPGRSVLKSGSIRREGARALSCGILLERDVPVRMRDGTVIRCDVFRPTSGGPVPALIAWSPYGKQIGGQWLDDFKGRAGVPVSHVSELQKFEGPDPAHWVAQGYAVIQPDPRGVGMSDGNMTFFGRQLGEDGYDTIEWAGTQPWCTGKVALTGNSWLAVSQWFIAAERPPHLAAIAPWEGLCDHFRDTGNRGGIPAPQFPDIILQTMSGRNLAEDMPRMIVEQQLITPYWLDKRAEIERIEVPAYVAASYTNGAHTLGTFLAFRRLTGPKWLRVHNTHEWYDYYDPKHVADLQRFFDHFLKGQDTGWEKTPPVRLAVLDPGGTDTLDRAEPAFPPARAQHTPFYLTADGKMSAAPVTPGQTDYKASGGKAVFEMPFDKAVEIVGYMKLKLWVEANGSNDIDIDISVEKIGTDGQTFVNPIDAVPGNHIMAFNSMRASHRALDPALSTPSEPLLIHTHEDLLKPGEVVPLEIGLSPMGLRLRAGEKLRVTVTPFWPIPAVIDLGFGTGAVTIPKDGMTFMPGETVPMRTLVGGYRSGPGFVRAQRVPDPPSRNKGRHVIHVGGQYDSHLLVPILPA